MFSTIRAVRSCLLRKFLFILIFVALGAQIHVAHGQVVIKETVTLTSEVTGTPTRLTGNVFVASDSGTYWGRIGLARKYTPITFGPLTVVHRDTTYVFDTREYVLQTWSWQQVQWRCSDPNTPIWYTAYYAYDTENPLRFFLPDVHVGDTIRFMYAGVWGTDDCPLGGVSASICMYASDSCYYYMEGELQELWHCTVDLGVLSAEQAGYRVVAEDDTIGAGTSTPVRAIAVDSTDWEVPIDSTTRLVYRLIPDTLGKFIDAAGDTLPSPLPNVLYADARAGRIRFLAREPDSMQVAVIEAVQMNDTTKRGEDTIYVRPEKFAILLGQTKYFRAEDDQEGRLTIKEYDVPPPIGPLSDITWIVTPVAGSRLGAYYEDRDSTGTEFEGTDRIRLVGRYWYPDTTFEVRLKALHGGRSDSIIISVEKPHSLGSTHNLSKGVFNNRVNIDSICSIAGGKYGIPPQLIKGQMQKETYAMDFGGEIGSGFAPGYLYEPYTLQFDRSRQTFFATNRFRVTGRTEMGTDPVPTNHQHVQLISYPTTGQTVWDMIRDYSQIKNNTTQGARLYGKRVADHGDSLSFGYRPPRVIYNKILSAFKDSLDVKKNPSRRDSAFTLARDSLARFLQNEWDGGISTNPKGLDSIWAQTRMASSYGLLQITYPVAVDRGYLVTQSNTPERLNIDSVYLPYCMENHRVNFQAANRFNLDVSNSWSTGFDEAIRKMVQRWNPYADGYGNLVVKNSKHFLPKSE